MEQFSSHGPEILLSAKMTDSLASHTAFALAIPFCCACHPQDHHISFATRQCRSEANHARPFRRVQHNGPCQARHAAWHSKPKWKPRQIGTRPRRQEQNATDGRCRDSTLLMPPAPFRPPPPAPPPPMPALLMPAGTRPIPARQTFHGFHFMVFISWSCAPVCSEPEDVCCGCGLVWQARAAEQDAPLPLAPPFSEPIMPPPFFFEPCGRRDIYNCSLDSDTHTR